MREQYADKTNVITKKINYCKECRINQLCISAQLKKSLLQTTKHLQFESLLLEPMQYLYRQGEQLDCLFAIRSGILKSFTTLEDGSEYVMSFHLPPSLFGWEAIDKNQLSVSVVAIEYSNICKIPLDALQMLTKKYPEIQSQLFQLVSVRIQNDNAALLRSTAEQRVAHFVLRLNEMYNMLGYAEDVCKIYMTHQDIANYLRIAPETISRTFRQLQTRKIITFKHKDIYILNRDALSEIAHSQ